LYSDLYNECVRFWCCKPPPHVAAYGVEVLRSAVETSLTF
jgi:hypothetical protein